MDKYTKEAREVRKRIVEEVTKNIESAKKKPKQKPQLFRVSKAFFKVPEKVLDVIIKGYFNQREIRIYLTLLELGLKKNNFEFKIRPRDILKITNIRYTKIPQTMNGLKEKGAVEFQREGTAYNMKLKFPTNDDPIEWVDFDKCWYIEKYEGQPEWEPELPPRKKDAFEDNIKEYYGIGINELYLLVQKKAIENEIAVPKSLVENKLKSIFGQKVTDFQFARLNTVQKLVDRIVELLLQSVD